VGHLPARNVRVDVRFKYANGENYNDFPISDGKGNFVAAPGITLRQGSGDSIGGPDILKLSKEKLFFYVSGAVYYHDGFVDGRQTRFCHRSRWEIFGHEGNRLIMSTVTEPMNKRAALDRRVLRHSSAPPISSSSSASVRRVASFK
jgi:hypothetical protein